VPFAPTVADYSLTQRMISHNSVEQEGGEWWNRVFSKKLMNPRLVSLNIIEADCWRQSKCDVSTGYHQRSFSPVWVIRLETQARRNGEFFDISIISFSTCFYLTVWREKIENRGFFWGEELESMGGFVRGRFEVEYCGGEDCWLEDCWIWSSSTVGFKSSFFILCIFFSFHHRSLNEKLKKNYKQTHPTLNSNLPA
jgi:hypothetical protein